MRNAHHGMFCAVSVVTLFLSLSTVGHVIADSLTYTIVDTALSHCYGSMKSIPCPEPGRPFFGQDAQYLGNQPKYKNNGDGTITDLNTGLVWQKTPDFIKRSWKDAGKHAESLDLAGHNDWRLPTIKELFSLADFRGNIRTKTPYIDTKYFDFRYPDTTKYRIIDAQYWTSNLYVGLVMHGMPGAFGFNFADGRIKVYPVVGPRGSTLTHRDLRYVRCVRGPRYGINDFKDNGDGTITDRATGLMWNKFDSSKPMNWQNALAYAQDLEHAGYDDWRLPNVKELQSIVDYSRAPDARPPAKKGPALDPIFKTTIKEPWYWSSTTFIETGGALYVAIGRGLSAWRFKGGPMNAHGAGCVRSDPKSGDPSVWVEGRGPQGDQVRIFNYVRCVRGGAAKLIENPPGSKVWAQDIQGPAERFIGRLDKNKDGKVSRMEFDGPPIHFKDFDKDNDGYISTDEAPTGPPPRRPPRRAPRPGQRQRSF